MSFRDALRAAFAFALVFGVAGAAAHCVYIMVGDIAPGGWEYRVAEQRKAAQVPAFFLLMLLLGLAITAFWPREPKK